jgi:hypothetical protein
MQSISEAAPFAFVDLDRLFHERARFGIVTSLAGNPEGGDKPAGDDVPPHPARA